MRGCLGAAASILEDEPLARLARQAAAALLAIDPVAAAIGAADRPLISRGEDPAAQAKALLLVLRFGAGGKMRALPERMGRRGQRQQKAGKGWNQDTQR